MKGTLCKTLLFCICMVLYHTDVFSGTISISEFYNDNFVISTGTKIISTDSALPINVIHDATHITNNGIIDADININNKDVLDRIPFITPLS